MFNSKKHVQRVHKTRNENYISIPVVMRDAIHALPITSQYRQHVLKFIAILRRESYRQYHDVFHMVDIPNNYLIETFGNRYKEWFFILQESRLILRNDFYSKEGNQCYKYSINQLYYHSNSIIPLCSNNLHEGLSIVTYSDIAKEKFEDVIYRNHFKKCMEGLEIDFAKLRNITAKRIDELSILEFRINEQVRENVIKLRNAYHKEYNITKENAIIKATELNKVLVQDGNKFYIIDPVEFVQRKKLSILMTYNDAVLAIERGNLRAGRNKTNNRLDTNITNLCSLLTDEIANQNNLVQIDLSNSQFAILSYILQYIMDTDDYKRFKELSVIGGLYEFVQENLGLESRKEAKNAMFEILFSKRRNNTKSKSKLKKLFPTVIEWVDNYKKENGDDNFSIMLQKKESEIFIDMILNCIIKKKIFALTKHDSLIVKESDKEKVLELISDYFKLIGFEYNLKITMPNETV